VLSKATSKCTPDPFFDQYFVSSGISCVHQLEEVDSFVSDTDNTLIDNIDRHVMSMVNLYAPDSALTHYDDSGEHQVKAMSSASVGLLDSDEAWATLFHEKRTSIHLTFPSGSPLTEPVVAHTEAVVAPNEPPWSSL
jgi:hypothetical protein